jgi:hypothetical protein
MRKYALPMMFAGAMLATAVGLPNHAIGMNLGASMGGLGAAVPTQLEQTGGWCAARRSCLGRAYYQSRPPYAYYSYRPWPYYNYFLGSGWPTYGWYK